MNQNQNQRYEARVGFKSTVFMPCGMNRGMNALMAFPGYGISPERVRCKTSPALESIWFFPSTVRKLHRLIYFAHGLACLIASLPSLVILNSISIANSSVREVDV